MTQITQTQLETLLMGVEKSTFVHLVTETIVKMNKTNNPFFDKVIKRSSCNFLIGNDYEKRVQTNEKKEGLEGNFQSGVLSGKEHITKCVLKDKTTGLKRYLMVERFKEVKPKVDFIFEGNSIDKTLFESYMGKVSENKSQPQENKVVVNTYLLESIKQISLDGEKYEIV